MTPRLLYLVEWRERGEWCFRMFTMLDAALRVSRRVANRVGRAMVLTVLPGDVRMLQAGAECVA